MSDYLDMNMALWIQLCLKIHFFETTKIVLITSTQEYITVCHYQSKLILDFQTAPKKCDIIERDV